MILEPHLMPGFDRLISTLKQYGIGADLKQPAPNAPRAGAPILGAPLDPMLASLYARCDGGLFGDVEIFGFRNEQDDTLITWNQSLRESRGRSHPELEQCVEYGKEVGEAHYLATVPSLENPDGIQPVVCIAQHLELRVFPIASSVDRAFDLWARHVEPRLLRHGRLDE